MRGGRSPTHGPSVGDRVDDHSRTQPDGPRLWHCDACGLAAPWGEGWSYYGLPEHRLHGYPVVEVVACSPECREALAAERGVPNKPIKE